MMLEDVPCAVLAEFAPALTMRCSIASSVSMKLLKQLYCQRAVFKVLAQPRHTQKQHKPEAMVETAHLLSKLHQAQQCDIARSARGFSETVPSG